MSTFETLVILMYFLIGVTGALSFLVFTTGMVLYFVRLGTERRIRGIRIMEWGVRLIVTSIILIGTLRLLEG